MLIHPPTAPKNIASHQITCDIMLVSPLKEYIGIRVTRDASGAATLEHGIKENDLDRKLSGRISLYFPKTPNRPAMSGSNPRNLIP